MVEFLSNADRAKRDLSGSVGVIAVSSVRYPLLRDQCAVS